MSVPETQNDTVSLSRSQSNPTGSPSKPKVLIVGAGIGGLMLGNLLQKGGVSYEIYERAKEIVPLGSAISMGCCFAQLFKQIGIYDEFVKLGKPNRKMELFNTDLEPILDMDSTEREIFTGSIEYIVARPDLYDLLLRQIPKERIHMNTKVASFEQDSEQVTIRCVDGSLHQGNILVGADGAHSAIRQQLFTNLRKSGALPPSDDVPLPFNCVCLVGQTEVLDPEEYPGLKLEHSQFYFVVGDDDYSWSTFATKKNSICWFVIKFLKEETFKDKDSSENTEWGNEAAEAMCQLAKDFKIPLGKDGAAVTMGQLIDRTPKHLISKVKLEEKLFETWHSRRVVLLGDACHKLNPASGAGALTAIQDAVALANWICTLESASLPNLETIFNEYHAERYPLVKSAFAISQVFKNIGGTNFTATLTRAIFKYMPQFLMSHVLKMRSASRPQVSFLPQIENKGTVEPVYQASLQKTLEIIKQRSVATAV